MRSRSWLKPTDTTETRKPPVTEPARQRDGNGNGKVGASGRAKSVQRALDEAQGDYQGSAEDTGLEIDFPGQSRTTTPRNRSLASQNVFLHLHPAKINRDAVRYKYTWGMGGITFYLFIVLTFTGMLLMFYYHPSKVVAFRDILYLETTCRSASCCGICIAGPRT